jgi:hypothetical protein
VSGSPVEGRVLRVGAGSGAWIRTRVQGRGLGSARGSKVGGLDPHAGPRSGAWIRAPIPRGAGRTSVSS